MSLSITSRVENEIGILDLEGSLTLGPSLRTLREAAKEVLSTGRLAGLVLKIADVSAADSAGLGELTVVYTLATKANCKVALAGVNTKLRSMLEITRLDGLLPSCDDISSAKKLISG